MPKVGFEPTISVFERAKTVPALDRAAAVIGDEFPWLLQFLFISGVGLTSPGTAATSGLLYSPKW
jgi:hypothetical protein